MLNRKFKHGFIVRRLLVLGLIVLIVTSLNKRAICLKFRVEKNDSVPEYFNQNFLRFENHLYKENIRTLIIYKDGWELSHPIIDLNSDDKIKLSFDDLDGQNKNYYYKLIHCNSKWEPSGIVYNDFIEGFETNQIIDYKISFNTFQKYIHYNLIIPNNDIKLKLSGNYLIKIFEDNNEDDLVLTARFYCVEHLSSIDAFCKRSILSTIYNENHEIDFNIKTNLSISNPQRDLKVVLKQNNRDDNAIIDLKPLFINGNELKYDYDDINCFSAGAEYLYFDIKSIRYQSERIYNIEYIKPSYYVNLIQDEVMRYKPYVFNTDLNGKYLVKIQESDYSESEADYVYINFYLKYNEPIVDGNIYVFGQLTNWQFSNLNKMKYNFQNRRYELQLYMKQGYYNYTYGFVKDGENNVDLTFINGSYYETENDYNIFVYYKDISLRYEKLIGHQVVNSNYKK